MENYIAFESKFNEIKKKNFFMFEAISAFVWMCFHFTLVFFFMIKLESLVLVGIFLGIGNLVSFIVDSPIGVIQKYFKAKQIFIFGAFLKLIVSVIFVYFIYKSNSLDTSGGNILSIETIKSFLSGTLNVILLLISVILYGISKEINDVTSISYITNNADPSEYSELFSKYNIYYGAGSLIGLIVSGIILAFYILVAVIILVLIIIFYIFFISKYFDSSVNEIKISDFKKIKLITKDSIINSIKNYSSQIIENKEDLIEKTKNIKVIFLKPIELKEKIDFKEIYKQTIEDLKSFFEIIATSPYNYRLLVIGSVFVVFGFWDTFVTSFLIDYINQVLSLNGEELAKFNLQDIFTAYVFIALFSIPAYGLQMPFVKIVEKIGVLNVILFGVLLSSFSMFLFGMSTGIYVVLIAGLINGVGYAACMPTSQGEFSTEYNNTYAKKKNLKQIDANASSAPTKMLSNLANVLGLMTGGLLLQAVGYKGTFFAFGFILLIIFVISIKNKEKYKL